MSTCFFEFRFAPKNAIYLIAACALSTWATASFSQNLAPIAEAGSTVLNPAWQMSGLPGGKGIPSTRFEATLLDGEPALRISTNQSYGVLSHAWQGPAPTELAWRWRMDTALDRADVATKAGDDAALKVCVMFDQPMSEIPFLQRTGLALARAATKQDLPSATLCYVWDKRYAPGTSGANPYSARVRYIVLDGLGAPLGQWASQRRRVAEDFQRLFGKESPVTPPVIAVAIGGDSDNTQGQSQAYLSQLRWLP